MNKGDVVNMTHWNAFQPGIQAGYKPPLGRVGVFLLLGDADKKAPETFDAMAAMRDLGWELVKAVKPVATVVGFQEVRHAHRHPTVAWAVQDLPVGTELFTRPPLLANRVAELEELLRDTERSILKHQAECPMSRQQSYRTTKIRAKIKRALGIIK